MGTFVGTARTTLAGTPKEYPVYDEDGFASKISWACPDLISTYSEAQPCIDVHNKYRALIGLEKTWRTKRWWIRFYTGMLGIFAVNAYLMFKLTPQGEHRYECVERFVSELAHQLIFNEFIEDDINAGVTRTRVPRAGGHENLDPNISRVSVEEAQQHTAARFSTHPDGKPGYQKYCKICKKKSSFYCRGCGFHGPAFCSASTRGCITKHRRDICQRAL